MLLFEEIIANRFQAAKLTLQHANVFAKMGLHIVSSQDFCSFCFLSFFLSEIVQLFFFCAHSHLKFFFYPTSPLELRIIYYGSVHEMRKTLLFHQHTFLDSKLMLMSIINKLYKALYFEEFVQFE